MRARRMIPLLLLSGMLPAQVYGTLPAGYLRTEADSGSRYFGFLATGRSMLMTSRAKAVAVTTMKEIAFRPNFENYALRPVAARRWSSMTLSMAEGDLWAATNFFSGKLKTTPTRVFAAAVTWPAMRRIPATRPAAFRLRFPFQAPWRYSGRFDLLADFVYTGGSSSARYPLDFAQNTNPTQPPFAPAVQVGSPACRDSALATPARLESLQYLFSAPNSPNLMRFVLAAYGTANTNALLAIGTAGSMAGVVLPGVSCQRLFVDLTRPTVYVPIQSGLSTPWLPVTGAGAEFWLQLLWPDSLTGAPRLTNAVRQGVFEPAGSTDHFEMFGTGNLGGTHRLGAPLYRYIK